MSDDESVSVPVTQVEKRGRGAPKGKRTPTPAQLETLAKARHRASEIRKLRTIVELEDIIAEKKASMPELTRFEPEIILPPNQIKPVPTEKVWPVPNDEPPPDLPSICESIVTPDEMKNQQIQNQKKKKKTRIIIEQSSSDEDVFESTDDVIFVKRRGRKDPPKKEVIPEPEPVPVKVDPYSSGTAAYSSGTAAYMQPIKSVKFTPDNYFHKRFY